MKEHSARLIQRLVRAIASTLTGSGLLPRRVVLKFPVLGGSALRVSLYPVRVGFVSTAIVLVAVAWALHRRFRERSWMSHSTLAFVGGGTISGVGVWLVYLWLLLVVSIITSEYP